MSNFQSLTKPTLVHCCCKTIKMLSPLPAQFNHLSVVRLKVVLPAHSDPISGHS